MSESIATYIATFPPHIRQLLEQMYATIRAAVPEGTEETIGYGMPTFKWHGNLVHFAGYNHHIGFYPAPSGLQAFAAELAGYKGSKGAVQFPLDQPLPLELVTKIVQFRVAENLAKAAEKAAKKKKKAG